MHGLLPIPGLTGGIALVFFLVGSFASGSTTAASPDTSSPEADSSEAWIEMHRDGDQLRIQGLFRNEDHPADTLTYALSVRRVGAAGTSQTAQSGSFSTAPGQTDTLSTTRINVQAGDELTLRLAVQAEDETVDEHRIERTLP